MKTLQGQSIFGRNSIDYRTININNKKSVFFFSNFNQLSNHYPISEGTLVIRFFRKNSLKTLGTYELNAKISQKEPPFRRPDELVTINERILGAGF